MRKIEALEKAIREVKEGMSFSELGINATFWRAYQDTNEANETIDFSEVIWERDVKEIVEQCKQFGITEFTISSPFSGLIETLAMFEDEGCKMAGLVHITSRITKCNFGTGKIEYEIVPAIRMEVVQ